MKINVAKEGVKYGIIGGLIILLVTYGSWGLCTVPTFLSVSTIFNFIPYMIVILIVAGLGLRKKNDNVLTFKDALKFAFLTYVIIALTEAVGTYILYNVLDHDLTAKAFEVGKEKMVKMLQKFGTSDEKIEEAVKKMDKDGANTDLKKIVLGTGYTLIWYFCKSLLIALVIRREQKFED